MILKSIVDIENELINEFSCGNRDLDLFLKKHAFKNDQIGYGKTFVGIENNQIIGFFTLCSASIKFESLPKGNVSSLPRYPIPCIRIARLAVKKEMQNKGYGKLLLKEALLKIIYASATIGIRLVVVDAKETAKFFYAKYGFQPLIEEESTLFLEIETIINAYKLSK